MKKQRRGGENDREGDGTRNRRSITTKGSKCGKGGKKNDRAEKKTLHKVSEDRKERYKTIVKHWIKMC